MEYPSLMYKCPGNHQCFGGTYNYCAVADDEEAANLSKDGWYPSLVLAQATPEDFSINAYLGTEDQGEAAPTRAELIQKAEELGIAVDKKTGSKTLLSKINKALGE